MRAFTLLCLLFGSTEGYMARAAAMRPALRPAASVAPAVPLAPRMGLGPIGGERKGGGLA